MDGQTDLKVDTLDQIQNSRKCKKGDIIVHSAFGMLFVIEPVATR